jgi:DNA replication protein DnaC
MDALLDYVANIRENWMLGKNVILYGGKGTGKDHLLMGLARFAFGQCQSVTWRNGADLFAEFRDTMGGSETEAHLLRKYSTCKVLWISDPIPVAGELTPYQGATLFSIVDARYRECLPTWVTINVASATDFSRLLLPQVADRLRDGALCIHCNWASYRKPMTSIH